MPALVTAAIAMILFVWALYAFSAAGFIRRLPLLRTALVLIAGIYLLRGFALVPLLILQPGGADTFATVSSLVVLVYGLAYAIGTWKAWPGLRTAGQAELERSALCPSADSARLT